MERVVGALYLPIIIHHINRNIFISAKCISSFFVKMLFVSVTRFDEEGGAALHLSIVIHHINRLYLLLKNVFSACIFSISSFLQRWYLYLFDGEGGGFFYSNNIFCIFSIYIYIRWYLYINTILAKTLYL